MLLKPMYSAFVAVCVATALAAGCSMTPTAGTGPIALQHYLYSPSAIDAGATSGALKGPLVIAVDGNNGSLEGYPMQPGGSNKPRQLTKKGLFGYGGIVANGHVVAALAQYPPGIVLYDLDTGTSKTLPDPNGTPVDMATGKDDSLYVINFGKGPTNVTWYPGGQANPKKLLCNAQNTSENIAVDNEGDIFLNGYSNNNIDVVEIPNGPNGPEPGKCKALSLQPETGYEAGLAIDPKTDALITLEDPDLCAGGEEGRMTIYPKPYKANNFTFADIGQNCTGGLRLNRDSTIIFTGDEDVSGSYTFMIQSAFPSGRFMGEYHNGQPGGFTTIPNRLPN
jgi:hypothetical protein